MGKFRNKVCFRKNTLKSRFYFLRILYEYQNIFKYAKFDVIFYYYV